MEEKNKKTTINKKALVAIIIAVVAVVAILLVVLFKNDLPEYNITFNSNGGSSVEALVIEENGKITKPEDPTKEGYVFVGWYLDGELYDFNEPVTKNIELEARWELPADVTGVELDKTKLTLNVGEEAKLVATVSPVNAKDKSLTWKSSDTKVVTVDENGNVKAVGKGTATITVTTNEGNFKAKVSVTVEEKETETQKEEVKVTGVTLNKTKLSLEVNESSKLTATVKPSNATNKDVTWKSSNTNVATVDKNGNVKAVSAGTTTITVTTKDGKFTAKATVTVTKKEEPKEETVKVTGVELDKTNLTLTEGQDSKLTATVKPSNATDKNVTWTSSNTAVVTVDKNGNVKAVSAGTATITVTTKDGNFKASATVTVNEKPASYTVTFTEIKQELTELVLEYSMKVTKNGSSFSNFKGIRYNNTVVKETLAKEDCNKSVTTAIIVLSDGSEVTANVIYK